MPLRTEILKLKPDKRSWILQAIRHFGNYYNYKTNNPECKELIEKIINRYGLNIGLDMHQKIYIVDDNYVVNKVKDLLEIPGEIGLTVKVGLYSGLRQEEIIYLHNTDICNNLRGCSCNKLHVIKKPSVGVPGGNPSVRVDANPINGGNGCVQPYPLKGVFVVSCVNCVNFVNSPLVMNVGVFVVGVNVWVCSLVNGVFVNCVNFVKSPSVNIVLVGVLVSVGDLGIL